MGWTSYDEEDKKKKEMETSTKILIGMGLCVLIIIILIIFLMFTKEVSTFTMNIDGKKTTTTVKNSLITTLDNETYINIKDFSKLVGYEYHNGEYKNFTIEEGKCYVQGKEETATFYVGDNKIRKLAVEKIEDEYSEISVKNEIKEVNGQIYAPIEAINIAFNSKVKTGERDITIQTLDYLVKLYDKEVKKWGYTGISEQNFESKKTLMYGYLIVNKENGLYKIINIDNTEEIVSDKYKEISFSEGMQEFLVKNSLDQMGIINLDGTTKIEPMYELLEVFDNKSGLYLIQKDSKYGLIQSGDVTVIPAEYDNIGIQSDVIKSVSDSSYLILDKLIPVCKNSKWGAFDKNGKMIYELKYDGFGCEITEVKINEKSKKVLPVLSIAKCNGVVVKQNDKYGVVNIEGEQLVPISVDSIYTFEIKGNEEPQYYMLYKGREMNIIQRLIEVGLLKEEKPKEEKQGNDIIVVDIVQKNKNEIINNSIN